MGVEINLVQNAAHNRISDAYKKLLVVVSDIEEKLIETNIIEENLNK